MPGYVPRAMVMTPWGDAGTLRSRQLPPGRGRPREEVQQNQRERLFAALVAVAADKEYDQVSVADLVEVSGVSSRSFYELFADKEACFLAVIEEILGSGTELAQQAIAAGPQDDTKGYRAVEIFVSLVAAQPAAARLCLVTAFCAGEKPRARIDQALEEYSALLQQALEGIPGHSGLGGDLVSAILGGIAVVLYDRLAERKYEEVRELAPSLRAWALSIPPPPAPLRPKTRRRRPSEAAMPSNAAYIPIERVIRSFASVIAEKEYGAATVADVVATAHISQATFYKHFRDKRDAFSAALESSGAQMVAATVPAVRRHGKWPGALRVALEAVCGFLAAEHDFAELREVEAYAVGPAAVKERDRARNEIIRGLAALTPPEERLAPLPVEAALGAYQALLFKRVREHRWEALADVPPLVTYLVLAPIVGAQPAWELAVA